MTVNVSHIKNGDRKSSYLQLAVSLLCMNIVSQQHCITKNSFVEMAHSTNWEVKVHYWEAQYEE